MELANQTITGIASYWLLCISPRISSIFNDWVSSDREASRPRLLSMDDGRSPITRYRAAKLLYGTRECYHPVTADGNPVSLTHGFTWACDDLLCKDGRTIRSRSGNWPPNFLFCRVTTSNIEQPPSNHCGMMYPPLSRLHVNSARGGGVRRLVHWHCSTSQIPTCHYRDSKPAPMLEMRPCGVTFI